MKKTEEIWETLSVAENREELAKEIKIIEDLIQQAKGIIQKEEEIKLRELKKALSSLLQKYPERKDKKILVFTESRDTLEYLERKIRDWGYAINTIHGGMRLEERINAEKVFKNETDVLVATEAAGEGINLQFCHMMVNYDIPWNPNRLEQRMGRIHRYGQQKAEGKIKDSKSGFLALESVPFQLRKIAEDDSFKKSYGELLKKYPKVTFDKDIAFKNSDAKFVSFGHPLFESVMVWTENFLSDSLINGATFSDPDGKMDGHILFYEGEIRDGTGYVAGKRLFGFYVSETETKQVSPAIIWDLAEEGNDKKDFNHEAHEEHEEKHKQTPSIEGKVKNNPIPLTKESIHNSPLKKEQSSESPLTKGDLGGCKETCISIDTDSLKKRVSGLTITKLEEYKQKLLEERRRQAEIKQKYGIKSLEHLIVKIDGELITLYGRKEQGENVDLVIRNKEERKADYENALKQLREQIQREQNLTMSMPRFVGMIKVNPSIKIDNGMQSDAEVEKTGMEIAMKYETENGRTPEDVSAGNLGFDIRSTVKDGTIRYIEVKTRAASGCVALTQNEWFKAKRFKDDYYLYTIMNAGKKPELYIIQNPVENLNVEEKVESVRYIIDQGEIKNKSVV